MRNENCKSIPATHKKGENTHFTLYWPYRANFTKMIWCILYAKMDAYLQAIMDMTLILCMKYTLPMSPLVYAQYPFCLCLSRILSVLGVTAVSGWKSYGWSDLGAVSMIMIKSEIMPRSCHFIGSCHILVVIIPMQVPNVHSMPEVITHQRHVQFRLSWGLFSSILHATDDDGVLVRWIGIYCIHPTCWR
jgi:hypothetical protein